jgi:RimJ/RimL family protein N-acetyltransferase
MSDNVRPMLYGARYTVTVAGQRRDEEPVVVDVVGRHCETGDILAEGVPLPHPVRRGDLLAFASTGAYTYSMASTYNRVGRPAVVAVRDGSVVPWLRREDEAELDRLEVAAPPPHPETAASPLPREGRGAGGRGVLIRPARPRDAARFLEAFRAVAAERRFVRTEVVAHSSWFYRRRFRSSYDERGAHLLAFAGDRLVGNVSIRRDDHPVARHVATLGMFVVAEHRGRGIGTALMEEAMTWARDHGVERVELSVYPQNEGALALYRRFGFEQGRLVRHSKKSYGYEDEIPMAAWIGRGRADPAGDRSTSGAKREEQVSERVLRVGMLGSLVGSAVIRLLPTCR